MGKPFKGGMVVEVTLQDLEMKVEQLREKLDTLALQKDSLATGDLLALSQELDQVLDQWTKLKENKE